jgi:hypothetical protein
MQDSRMGLDRCRAVVRPRLASVEKPRILAGTLQRAADVQVLQSRGTWDESAKEAANTID